LELLNIKNLDLAGEKVFIRCDFNVPMDEFGNISDDRRIRSAISTIHYCLDQNCAVILASHLGRPEGQVVAKYSLSPVAKRIQQLLKREVVLADDVVGEDALSKAAALKRVRFDARISAMKQADKQRRVVKSCLNTSFYRDAFGVSQCACSVGESHAV
jgi:phosphoglycerate kinase